MLKYDDYCELLMRPSKLRGEEGRIKGIRKENFRNMKGKLENKKKQEKNILIYNQIDVSVPHLIDIIMINVFFLLFFYISIINLFNYIFVPLLRIFFFY